MVQSLFDVRMRSSPEVQVLICRCGGFRELTAPSDAYSSSTDSCLPDEGPLGPLIVTIWLNVDNLGSDNLK